MFLLHKPSEARISTFISSQRDLPFSYPQVGATRAKAPAGFVLDQTRGRLGQGENTYRAAILALKSWKQFDLGWVRIVPPETELVVDAVVAVQAKAFGFWSLNACRVVYLIEEDTRFKATFGFAYGTLPDHVESGEERFRVEWHRDDSVWYDIYAFSRPQHQLVKWARPLARMLQKRFARDSLSAMVAATRE
jgi:uncharacterized protein (UPF0548 family)